MADEDADDQLREMAQHRGFRLVKSRRRKPGSGDYGKFGLTDVAGKPLLGMGENGLTASATDIQDYLRGGATNSWQQSAKITPNRAAQKTKTEKMAKEKGADDRSHSAKSAARGAKGRGHAKQPPSPSPKLPKPIFTDKVEAPDREPELIVRIARTADQTDLRTFLDRNLPDWMSSNLALVLKGGGVAVAKRGSIIGCSAWATLSTLQHGLVGRVTLLIVDEDFRRRGIGAQLLEAAVTSLGSKGCSLVEVMSDIEIRNFHGFYRAQGFEQKSYRFIRTPTPTHSWGRSVPNERGEVIE